MAGNQQRIPISMLLSDKGNEEDEPKKKSREDWRKAKELEEARKAGKVPAAVDEEGRDINPHIPQYISSAPWYYNTAGPTLKHQRPQEDKQKSLSGINEWYNRGVDTSQTVVTKYRKGACENCGAMTHKKPDCMERPRKVGARFSGKNIAYDEFSQPKISADYDGKRDRWAGYDPANHSEIVEEYQNIEKAKRELKAQKLKDDPNADDEDEDDDEDKYVDEVDMPGTKVDSKQRITVRNLRIREDTAKYLRNLDPNSAYYDPKTRSMRDNPTPHLNPEETDFAGENFVRFSGDIQKHAQAQMFAWEAHGKQISTCDGKDVHVLDVHILAEPTKLEMLQKEYEKKKDQFKDTEKNRILESYGGDEYLAAPPKSLLMSDETYLEYSRYGKVIKGEKPVIKSRFEEDVYINNHKHVWGSYWNNGQWGYKCCFSFIKNSYCIASDDDGTVPHEDRLSQSATTTKQLDLRLNNEETEEQKVPTCSHENSKKKKKKSKKRKEKSNEDKLKDALKAEDRSQKLAKEMLTMDERKRPYNSMFEVKEPTCEQMEAFMMKRSREDDPMLNF